MNAPYANYNTNYTTSTAPAKGSAYEPISTGGYIGLSLLMCIPVVGIILAVIWAFGGCKKINKRNYCRAMLIMMVIALIFSFLIGFAVKSLMGKALEEAGIDPTRLTEEGYLESLIPMEDLEELKNALESIEGLDPEALKALEGLNLEELNVPTGD